MSAEATLGYLYLAVFDGNRVKVGSTVAPSKRRAQLQAIEKIKEFHVSPPLEAFRKAEGDFKRALAAEHPRWQGHEWFECDAATALAAMSVVIGEAGEQTEFRRWRLSMGLSRKQAAEMLGISSSQAANYDTGVNRSKVGASVPGRAIRIAMRALKKKPAEQWLAELKQWLEEIS